MITYSFLDGPHTIGMYNNPQEGFTEPGGYSPMSAAEQAVLREAMHLWDDLIPLDFVGEERQWRRHPFREHDDGPGASLGLLSGPNTSTGKVGSDVWTADADGQLDEPLARLQRLRLDDDRPRDRATRSA